MATMVFSVVETIAPPWAEMAPVRLGSGDVHAHLLVERDGVPTHRLDLCRDGFETWHRIEAIWWSDRIVVGFGQRVYFVEPGEAESPCIRLQEYFGSFHPGDDWLLIASASDIFRADRQGRVAWRSAGLGIDGVLIRDVANGVILGDGEWDPPGGWVPFAISLADGSRVS